MTRWCETCDVNPIKARGECNSCLNYRWRTGKQRPVRLAEKQGDLNYRRFTERRFR